MRFASLSTPTYSTPRMAGLQAQTSTVNVTQAQKAEAFTPPSGRLQRQGFANVEQLERFAAHIKQQIERHNEICQYMMEDATVPAFGNELLSNFVGNKTQKFAYVPAWEETLEKLNEAIAFHQNKSAKMPTENPPNLGGSGWISKIKKLLKHPYLSYIYGLKNLGRYINLPEMKFLEFDLSGAILDGGNFTGASFPRANLDRASLRKTKLEGTNFNSAFLCHTSFKGARIGIRGSSNPTIFFGTYDLNKAHGLPEPIDTLCMSFLAWMEKRENLPSTSE
jgi:hypothetical protein